MPRLKRALGRLLGLVVTAGLLWLVVAEPVETGDLAGSRSLGRSLAALDAALMALPSRRGGELLAGGAKVEIAPPLDWDVPLGGNRRLRFARAEGTRPESVWARAVALRQGEAAFLLVAADIMVIYPEFADAILERIRRDVDIESHQLMLVAAHSHSGPGGYWQGVLPEMSVGPYQERLRAFLIQKLADAAVEAWNAAAPANAWVGGTTLELPVKNRARVGGPENAQLAVLRLEQAASGRTIDLVNYSAHPTNLLRDNRMMTGDYPALMAMRMEQQIPDHMLVFTPGTIGDQKPWYNREKNASIKAEAIAKLLHEGLLRADLERIEGPLLETLEFEVTMPTLQPRLVRSDWLGSWAARQWLASALFPAGLDRTVIQVARLGSTVLVGAPSDLATSVAEPLLKQGREAGLHVVFVSMAEDWIGYVMTQEEYEQVPYKESSQFHGPLSGPLFSELYGRLIASLAERASSDPRRAPISAAGDAAAF